MMRGLHPLSDRAPGVVLHILSDVGRQRLLQTQQLPQRSVFLSQPRVDAPGGGLLPGLEAMRLRVAAREQASSGG